MASFDELMDKIMSRGKMNQLGDFGSTFGASGIGKGIEDWTNPITQFSSRNPILSLLQGKGNLYGSYEPQGGAEETLNRGMGVAAMIYGGYAAGGAMAGGGASSAAGSSGGESSLGGLGGTSMGNFFGGASPLNLKNLHRGMSATSDLYSLYMRSKGR